MPKKTSNVSEVIASLRNFTETLIKKLVINVTFYFIKDTPLDTGWASANWIPNIGASYPDTAGDRPTEGVSLDKQTQQNGIAKVSLSYTLDQGAVYITNNVPYIGDLNDGTSAQAPRGFVQIDIAKGIKQTV